MIRMSQPCRRLIAAMLILPSLGCSVLTRECNDVACLEGLNISLTGGFDPDKTYTIALSRLAATGEPSPVMSCARTSPSTTGAQMTCTASVRFQADPHAIRIIDPIFEGPRGKLRVVISTDDVVVGQKDYDVAFATREINGRGCGECTGASIDVDFPVRPVWGAQGQRIRSGWCGDDVIGATGFVATDDQLSATQLQLLTNMQEVPDPAPSCPDGQMSCFMEVVYQDGVVGAWSARPSDGTCIPDWPERVVSFATFEPFRKTLGCWYSRELSAAARAAASGTAPLPLLEPSAICKNGIVATAGTTISVGVDVPDGAGIRTARRIGLDMCNRSVGSGSIQMQLYDPTGATLLASGLDLNDPSNETCQTIDYTFTTAGTYILKLTVPPTYLSGNVFLTYQ